MSDGITTEQADELERFLTTELGLPAELRTEVAGLAVAGLLWSTLSGAGSAIGVVAGPGWIGAAGLAAARRLLAWGALPTVVLGVPRSTLTPLAATNADRFEAGNGRVYELGAPLPAVTSWIDGLFGTHVHEPLESALAELIEAVNHDLAPTLAIDLPSGLDATTGKATLPAIRADRTLALGYPTAGVLKSFAKPLVGELLIADVGIPPFVWRRFGLNNPPHFDGQLWVSWNTT